MDGVGVGADVGENVAVELLSEVAWTELLVEWLWRTAR